MAKKKLPRPHKRAKTVFNKRFEDELFTLWAGGMTTGDIHKRYLGTEKEFGYRGILSLKEKNNWDDRRTALEKRIEEDTDDLICLANKKKIQVINDAMNAALGILEAELSLFKENPKEFLEKMPKSAKPIWVINKLQELERLLLIHNEVVNGINPKDTLPQGNTYNVNQFNISKEIEVLPEHAQTKLLNALTSPDDTIVEGEVSDIADFEDDDE